MPVFPSQDLYGKKICESYQSLLQIYGNNLVLDGSGSQQQFLNVTASYALNCNCPTGSGGGTTLYTGSTYPITASWALTASYSENCNFGSSISQSFSASIVWTFNHNLGDKYVIVQAVDANDNQIVPEVINLFDDNTAIIGFSVPTSGTAIATRGGLRKLTIVTGSLSNCCLQTGSTYPITASWALSSSYALTASYIGDSVVGTFVSSSTWTFNHNLKARPVVIQAYDTNYNQILPQDIVLTNDNTAILTFPILASGFAIATRSGFRTVVTGTPMYTGSTYPITSSWAEHTITSSYIQVTGVSYPVKRVYNNYTVVRTADYTILCDATSGSFDVKLPNPVGNTNIYNIKKIDTSGHRINVTVTNASFIDYDLTQSISYGGTNMVVQSDGTNQYWIL